MGQHNLIDVEARDHVAIAQADREDAIRWARELMTQGVRIVRLSSAKRARPKAPDGSARASGAPDGNQRT